MPYVARKRMTVSGERYAAGEPVPLDGMPAKLVRQMVDQRRVVFKAVEDESRPKPGLSPKSPLQPKAKATPTLPKAGPKAVASAPVAETPDVEAQPDATKAATKKKAAKKKKG